MLGRLCLELCSWNVTYNRIRKRIHSIQNDDREKSRGDFAVVRDLGGKKYCTGEN